MQMGLGSRIGQHLLISLFIGFWLAVNNTNTRDWNILYVSNSNVDVA